jgi:hypothetical protein
VGIQLRKVSARGPAPVQPGLRVGDEVDEHDAVRVSAVDHNGADVRGGISTVVVGAEDHVGDVDAAKRHLAVGLESPLVDLRLHLVDLTSGADPAGVVVVTKQVAADATLATEATNIAAAMAAAPLM